MDLLVTQSFVSPSSRLEWMLAMHWVWESVRAFQGFAPKKSATKSYRLKSVNPGSLENLSAKWDYVASSIFWDTLRFNFSQNRWTWIWQCFITVVFDHIAAVQKWNGKKVNGLSCLKIAYHMLILIDSLFLKIHFLAFLAFIVIGQIRIDRKQRGVGSGMVF